MRRLACLLALATIWSAYAPLPASGPGNLTQLLNELSRRRGVRIAFSHTVSDLVTVADSSFEGDVAEVLERWLRGTDLWYRAIEDYFYIYKVHTPPPQSHPTIPKPPSRPTPAPPPAPPAAERTVSYAPVLAAPLATMPPGPAYPLIRMETPLVPLRLSESGPVAAPPKWAIKTNLLYDATSTMNVGVELALGDRWTLDVSGNYNPWTFPDNRKMRNWLIQPEVRRWFGERFSGHFAGVHAHVGGYNWGGMLPWGFRSGKMFGSIENEAIRDHRYQGLLWGVGASYGYLRMLGRRWGIEATVGVGYARLWYDKFPCARCGQKIGHRTKHYFGPTKAGISLIYILK